jgi:hypothetical protein
MRLWSLHPILLDRKGLLALWREALLAQHVLHGKTKGYVNHPQLERFRSCKSPQGAIAAYLVEVHKEATRRGYKFDHTKIMTKPIRSKIDITRGQMAFEMEHLKAKLRVREPRHLPLLKNSPLTPHPLFSVVAGDIEAWERV